MWVRAALAGLANLQQQQAARLSTAALGPGRGPAINAHPLTVLAASSAQLPQRSGAVHLQAAAPQLVLTSAPGVQIQQAPSSSGALASMVPPAQPKQPKAIVKAGKPSTGKVE